MSGYRSIYRQRIADWQSAHQPTYTPEQLAACMPWSLPEDKPIAKPARKPIRWGGLTILAVSFVAMAYVMGTWIDPLICDMLIVPVSLAWYVAFVEVTS